MRLVIGAIAVSAILMTTVETSGQTTERCSNGACMLPSPDLIGTVDLLGRAGDGRVEARPRTYRSGKRAVTGTRRYVRRQGPIRVRIRLR